MHISLYELIVIIISSAVLGALLHHGSIHILDYLHKRRYQKQLKQQRAEKDKHDFRLPKTGFTGEDIDDE